MENNPTGCQKLLTIIFEHLEGECDCIGVTEALIHLVVVDPFKEVPKRID